jgi:hypothetical protein
MDLLIEHGRLLKPGFHDGHLMGIELVDDKAAVLKLRNLSGERYSCKLSGVERLLCVGFAESNIVGDIYIFSGIAPPVDILRTLMIAPHPSAEEKYHLQYEKVIQSKVQLVTTGASTLLAIDTSYGGDLYALCRSAEFSLEHV